MYRNSKSFFSLLEVILALIILSGTITALLKDRTLSMRRTTLTSEDRRALQLLKSKMTEIVLKVEEDLEGEFEKHKGFEWSAEWDEEEIEGLENLGMIQIVNLTVFTPSQVEHSIKRYVP
jgi:type II secretory pathway pseudopilin PulG